MVSRLRVETTTFPWRKPRHEILLLALVALVALAPVYPVNPQDTARLCLSQAIEHGHLTIDDCYGLDHSEYNGHIYSDKAPGLSLIQLPVAAALRLPDADTLHGAVWRLWVIRLLTIGIAYLVLVLVVGRIAEGLAPGFGPLALVAFGLGTLLAVFGNANFGHVPAAAAGFGAFVFAWKRMPLAAGLLAGTAVLVEYQAALILFVVGIYAVLPGRRSAISFAGGVVPGLALLGAYNWAAFGAPWHFSYNYIANFFKEQQETGFFGIGLPHVHAIYQVFVGNAGLLVISPVLALAGWGLVLMWRTHPREAAVCGAVTAAFLMLNLGYFDPYGGSPGPRFLIPALPFLAVGLGPAFGRVPRLAMALTAFSVIATTARMVIWNGARDENALAALARVPQQGWSSHFAQDIVVSAFGWLASSRALGVAAIGVFALAAVAVAVAAASSALRQPATESGAKDRPGLATRRGIAVAVVGVAALANAAVIVANPYPAKPDLRLEILGSTTRVPFRSHVFLDVVVVDHSELNGYGDIVATLELPDGMRLDGPVHYELGSGCRGTRTLRCDVGSLQPGTSTTLRLGLELTRPGKQTIRSTIVGSGQELGRGGSYTIEVD